MSNNGGDQCKQTSHENDVRGIFHGPRFLCPLNLCFPKLCVIVSASASVIDMRKAVIVNATVTLRQRIPHRRATRLTRRNDERRRDCDRRHRESMHIVSESTAIVNTAGKNRGRRRRCADRLRRNGKDPRIRRIRMDSMAVDCTATTTIWQTAIGERESRLRFDVFLHLNSRPPFCFLGNYSILAQLLVPCTAIQVLIHGDVCLYASLFRTWIR